MESAVRQIPLFPSEPDVSSGFSVRESARARRLSIKVYPRGRVEVVVPKRARPRDVQAFVEANRAWIERTRAAFADEHPAEPFRLPTRIDLPAIERRFGVTYTAGEAGEGVRYRLTGDILRLSGDVDDPDKCVAALRRWLSSTARKHFEPRLRRLSDETANPFKRMQVRGQKTCWGSHSTTGTISINYCLLFLSPALVRYLMIHELCHARHMNHSRRFWRLVGKFESDYRRLDRRLGESWRSIPTWVGIY